MSTVLEGLDKGLVAVLAARDGLLALRQEEAAECGDHEDHVLDRETYVRLRGYVQEVARQQFRLEETARARDPAVRERFASIVRYAVAELKLEISEADIPALVGKLFNDTMGFGPVEKYFFDPDVTEIIITGTAVRIMKKGKRLSVPERFESVEHAKQIIKRMIAPSGRRLDPASPHVNARLFDGSRLIAHIEPVAVDGVTATIRRFRQDINAAALVENRTVSREVMEFLRASVLARLNIVVSGGTGSGKTTVLNVLSSFIPEDESVITIENPAELQLQHPDVRRLEARPKNVEGHGEVTQRELVIDALRMFPDRIIVGEVRGGEAFDMLQAMNTGHEGSMTTGHANSARLMIDRLINMVQMANDINLPYNAIIDQISGGVDLIVHVQRERTGRRRLDHIVEVVGALKDKNGISYGIELNELWRYDSKTDSFVWVAKKLRQDHAEKLALRGGWRCPS